MKEVSRPTASVAQDEIGYFFSRDEENTFELVRRGQAAGGGISNQDYDELPLELKEELMAFDQTVAVPRQLVSVSVSLDSELVGQIQELLNGLHQTEEGRQILESLKKTRKFDLLPPESANALAQLEVLMELVKQD